MCVTVNKLAQLSVSETTVWMEMGVVYKATELSWVCLFCPHSWICASSGCRYLGMWSKGGYNGRGVLITSNGKLVEGMFTGGKLQVWTCVCNGVYVQQHCWLLYGVSGWDDWYSVHVRSYRKEGCWTCSSSSTLSFLHAPLEAILYVLEAQYSHWSVWTWTHTRSLLPHPAFL